MDWSKILSTSPNELSSEELAAIPDHLSSIEASTLSTKELVKLFELSRFIIHHNSNGTKKKRQSAEDQYFLGEKNVAKGGSDTGESYFIQTIQELNREIAQHVFNKKVSTEDSGTVNPSTNVDADSLQPLAVDSKRDLLYKIHVKNKYIKRLLSENETLKEEIEQQKEQIILLNVGLKQTTHKLTKAVGELSEQKNQNNMTADDMADLHAKINSVREQMTRIEMDKQKYKHDVLHLSDEIQKKINQWNEVLKRKCIRYQINDNTVDGNDKTFVDNNIKQVVNEIEANNTCHSESRYEVNILTREINKRNLIITEMQSLLIDLTMEISQSAAVINRIIKNLSKRETNFASNLDKLRNHLVKLLDRPTVDEHQHKAQIEDGKKLLEKTLSNKTLKRKTSKKHLNAK